MNNETSKRLSKPKDFKTTACQNSRENRKRRIMRTTSRSGGSAIGASTFTGSGGGGEGGRASASWVFLYSIAKTSLGALILLSTTCQVKD